MRSPASSREATWRTEPRNSACTEDSRGHQKPARSGWSLVAWTRTVMPADDVFRVTPNRLRGWHALAKGSRCQRYADSLMESCQSASMAKADPADPRSDSATYEHRSETRPLSHRADRSRPRWQGEPTVVIGPATGHHPSVHRVATRQQPRHRRDPTGCCSRDLPDKEGQLQLPGLRCSWRNSGYPTLSRTRTKRIPTWTPNRNWTRYRWTATPDAAWCQPRAGGLSDGDSWGRFRCLCHGSRDCGRRFWR